MPIYEFVCENCNEKFSELCDDTLTSQTICKCGHTAQKILSISNWIFNTSCSNPLNPTEEHTQLDTINDTCESRLLWEFWCPECKHIDERYIYKNEILSQKCDSCGHLMCKYVDSHRFELKYNPQKDICDWSHNSSQYWKQVKEDRRNGKKVKGLHEK